MVKENKNAMADLYRRVLPALRSKKKELHLKKITSATEKNIWDCLRKTRWNKMGDLTLFDIVDDILKLKEEDFLIFLNKEERR